MRAVWYDRQGAADEVLVCGELPTPNAGHGEVKQPSPRAIAMPINGWVRGMSVDLVDAQGREVPQRVLHHLNVIMPERRELFSQIMLRIGAAGPETKPWELPFFLGYRIHPGDSVLFTAMVHNPAAVGPYDQVVLHRG